MTWLQGFQGCLNVCWSKNYAKRHTLQLLTTNPALPIVACSFKNSWKHHHANSWNVRAAPRRSVSGSIACCSTCGTCCSRWSNACWPGHRPSPSPSRPWWPPCNKGAFRCPGYTQAAARHRTRWRPGSKVSSELLVLMVPHSRYPLARSGVIIGIGSFWEDTLTSYSHSSTITAGLALAVAAAEPCDSWGSPDINLPGFNHSRLTAHESVREPLSFEGTLQHSHALSFALVEFEPVQISWDLIRIDASFDLVQRRRGCELMSVLLASVLVWFGAYRISSSGSITMGR